jgi:hypothetical protein
LKQPKDGLGKAYANGLAIVIIDLPFDLKKDLFLSKGVFQALKGTMKDPENIYNKIRPFQAVGAAYTSQG